MDKVFAEVLPQPVDVDLHNIAVALQVLFIHMLAEPGFGMNVARVLQQITQQAEFNAGEVDDTPIRGVCLLPFAVQPDAIPAQFVAGVTALPPAVFLSQHSFYSLAHIFNC